MCLKAFLEGKKKAPWPQRIPHLDFQPDVHLDAQFIVVIVLGLSLNYKITPWNDFVTTSFPKLITNFFLWLFRDCRDIGAKSQDIPPKKFDFPGFEEHAELFGPHHFTWKTPTPPENIRTQIGFVLFFVPDLWRNHFQSNFRERVPGLILHVLTVLVWGPGCCSCTGFHLRLRASDCFPGLAFCFRGPWTFAWICRP